MLLIHGTVRPSKIQGLGFFSGVDVSKGQKIWQYSPLFEISLTDEALAGLPAHVRQWARRYGYYDQSKGGGLWIVEIDEGRFINHSDEPNITDMGDSMIAARDISAGEEITADYSDFLPKDLLRSIHGICVDAEIA